MAWSKRSCNKTLYVSLLLGLKIRLHWIHIAVSAETRPELKLGDVWRSPESRPPTAGSDRFETVDDVNYLRALEVHYAEAERLECTGELQRRVGRALKKEAKALDRKLAKRSGTQPLNVPSCGSVFKNPPGDHAGRLIESVGLKGHRIGGAQISPVHANFIANTGNACAADVLALIEMARVTVHEQTGLHLETEVHVLGGIS